MINKRKTLYLLVFIGALVVAISSATFAYFQASATSNNITGNIASFNLGLTITKETTNGNLIPIQDNYIEKAIEENCLVDTDMIVCQIYKVTLSNNGNTGVTLSGSVTLTETNGSSVTQLKWMKLTDSIGYDSSSTTNGMTGGVLADTYLINGNSSKDFYFVVWDSETETLDIGSYTGEVSFSTSTGENITAKFN